MDRCFIVVSGLPGSGKSTLAQQVASTMGLSLLDKDTILERLFEARGVGNAGWRRKLSREADRVLKSQATASDGAVLVSHWRLQGMAVSSGTPTEWIPKLSAKVVNIHCECDAEVAAERFFQRKRHPGHLDHEKSHSEILASIRRITSLGHLNIGPRVDVGTTRPLKLDAVLREVHSALEKLRLSD